MESTFLFYQRYISDLPKKKMLMGQSPIQAIHPTTQHPIEINADGSMLDKSTSKRKTKADLLESIYPFLSQAGIEKAIQVESTNSDLLSKPLVDSALQQAEKKSNKLEFFSFTGVDHSLLEGTPLWMDPKSDQLHFVQYSQQNFPICRISWTPGDQKQQITGVPRIGEGADEDRIWFVENPLQAVLLAKTLNEPVFMRPSKQMLEWNEYQKFLENKQIVCLQSELQGDWEFSFFPFLRGLNPGKTSILSLSIFPLTGGESLESWLTQATDPKKQILKVIERSSTSGVSMYDRQTYHSFVDTTNTQQMYYPQDKCNGQFWYGTQDGFVVSSTPLNCIPAGELTESYQLSVNPTPNEHIRLTRQEVLTIDTSYLQYRPKDTFEMIRNLLQQSVYFEHSSTYTMITLWIMGGYVYKLFDQYGYLHFIGDRGTGKTTALDILAACAFNGKLESQSTRAKLVQQVHDTGGTLCLDEFESNSIGSGDAYTQMLKAGYSYQGSYSKMSPSRKPIRLNVYSPKALASIDTMKDQALASRTIPVRTIAKPASQQINVWSPDSSDIQNKLRLIRRGGYILGLIHHQRIRREYRQVEPVIRLPLGKRVDNRQRQILAPLLAISRLIDTDGKPLVEKQLLEAMEISWYPDYELEITSLKVLEKQLKIWASDDLFNEWTCKDNILYIHNACWEGTSLADQLGGKALVLKWFSTIQEVKTSKTVHLNTELGVKSCTGFPLDLNLHKKTIRKIFSSKLSS